MKKISIALAMVGLAAAQMPEQPYVYSAEAGGPVANPSYRGHRTAYSQQQPAIAAYQRMAPAGQGYLVIPRMAPPFQRYSVDFTLGYGFMAVPDSKYATDVATFELEGAYNLTPQQSVTLSLGLAGGGETNDYWVREGGKHGHADYYPFTDSFDRYSFTLMAGYRYTQPLTRWISLQAGAKCGLDVQTLDVDYGYGWSGYPYGDYCDGRSNTKAGMAYAGYVNVLIHVSPHADVVVGYQFRGSTAKPTPETYDRDQSQARCGAMRWHEVRIGAAFHF